jgi:hypothetical protein
MVVGPDGGRFAGIVVGLKGAEEHSCLLASPSVIQSLGEGVCHIRPAVYRVDRDDLGVTALVKMNVGGDFLANVVDAVDAKLVTNFRHVNLTCVVGNAMLLR